MKLIKFLFIILISINLQGQEKILDSISVYDNVEYVTYKNHLILQVGNNTDEGYIYKTYIINKKTKEHKVFEDSCSNWDDLFFVYRDDIYYWCEYYDKAIRIKDSKKISKYRIDFLLHFKKYKNE